VSSEALNRKSEDEPEFGAEHPPFVEGQVSVLARSRAPTGLRTLVWRPASYSVALVDGALRIFRGDDERRAWHALGAPANLRLPKCHLVVGQEHVVTRVLSADAPPSPARRRRRGRLVPSLSDLPEDHSAPGEPATSDDEAPAPVAAAHDRQKYCTFELRDRGDRGGVPLLKFAAPPTARRDLDALHDALEAITLTPARVEGGGG